MGWKFDSQLPVYLQIERHIKSAIISGEYNSLEQIPSVRQLAMEAGVNPNTMQRALSELEDQGILESKRTSGRFVTSDQEILHKLREDEARELVEEIIKSAKRLGIGKEEIMDMIEKSEGWEI